MDVRKFNDVDYHKDENANHDGVTSTCVMNDVEVSCSSGFNMRTS